LDLDHRRFLPTPSSPALVLTRGPFFQKNAQPDHAPWGPKPPRGRAVGKEMVARSWVKLPRRIGSRSSPG
jgi:hypothetical protein